MKFKPFPFWTWNKWRSLCLAPFPKGRGISSSSPLAKFAGLRFGRAGEQQIKNFRKLVQINRELLRKGMPEMRLPRVMR